MAKAKSRKGFTIIEVVLVLAVAGLIFLMVFVALPALQRSQKDTQRRDDYSMLSAAISSYSASNNGRLYKLAGATNSSANSSSTLTASKYINDTGEDPDGEPYVVRACFYGGGSGEPDNCPKLVSNNEKLEQGGTEPEQGQVYVLIKADCSGTFNGHDYPAKNTSNRAFAVYGYLASGSGTYCSASQ